MYQRIIRKTFYRFFAPSLVSSIALAIISMTDLIVAGRLLGEEAFTAISLALPIIIFVQIVAAFLGTGMAIVLSTYLGKGDQKTCDQIFSTSLIVTLLIGMALTGLGTYFLKPIILFCGATDGVILHSAKQYIGTLFYGMIPMIFAPIFLTILRNDSRPKFSMVCVLISGIFNLICNLIFVKGYHLGVRGISLATVCSQVLVCCMAIGPLFFRKKSSFHFQRRAIHFPILRLIFLPGISIAFIYLLQMMLTIFVNHILMKQGGANGVAIYAVIKYLITFIYAFYDGITSAIQPMISVYYGEKENQNIWLTKKVSFPVLFGAATIIFLVLELATPGICMLFGLYPQQGLYQQTLQAIRIQALFCFSAAFLTYIGTFYRCTIHAKFAFFLVFCNNFFLPIPIIFCLAEKYSFGVSSVWIGLVFADYITVFFWFLFFLLKKGSYGILLLSIKQEKRKVPMYQTMITGREEEMEQITTGIQHFCAENQVDSQKRYYISLCIEELVVNIVQMALANKKKVMIDIKILIQEDGFVQVRIRDDATEFDPTELDECSIAELENNKTEEEYNDFGIALVKKVAKDYSYRRTIGFNNFMVIL